MRYQGQSATLRLPWLGLDAAGHAFHERHRERYGYALDVPVELVNVRLTATGHRCAGHAPAPHGPAGVPGRAVRARQRLHELAGEPSPVYRRPDLARGQEAGGPGIIVVEPQATLYIAPGWKAVQQDSGSLLLEHIGRSMPAEPAAAIGTGACLPVLPLWRTAYDARTLEGSRVPQ